MAGIAGLRVVRTVAVVAGAVGSLSGVTYGLLNVQSRRAESVIGEPEAPPINADGVYLPDGSGPHPFGIGPDPLRFGVLGDSAAAGLGVDHADELPGVLLAKAVAEEARRPVLLTTYAVCGATSADLASQVDEALSDPPTVALVIVGANDVTTRLSARQSARLLEVQLARLRTAASTVVMGTCPDLGAIRPIQQPLRSVASALSRLLARAQRAAVLRAECTPVSLGELLSPEFYARPDDLFSPDRFHPNAAGYAAAAAVLLPSLCVAAGVWTEEPPAPTPLPARRAVPAVRFATG